MKPVWIAVMVLAVLLASACSIKREINPVARTPGEREICIIEDPAVREGFLQTYRRELESKGYVVRLLPKGSLIDACPLTTTYLGRWSWDLAIYLAYAEINVYRNGERAGQALFDARRGGGRLDKFGSGESRIVELVSELFP